MTMLKVDKYSDQQAWQRVSIFVEEKYSKFLWSVIMLIVW
jgi:hypothetical protein